MYAYRIYFIIKAHIDPFSVFLKHMQINVSFKVALNIKYSELSVETFYQGMHINLKWLIFKRQNTEKNPIITQLLA